MHTRTLPLVAVLCLLCTSSARAQDVCIPKVAGVPGMWGSPPDLNSTTWLDDHPNWRGSMAVGHAYGNGQFRALHDEEAGPAKYLYMQWTVSGPTGNIDVIKFAFRHGTAGEAFKYQLDMSNKLGVGAWPAGTTADAVGLLERKQWNNGSSTWDNAAGTSPSSLETSARFFVDCPGAPAVDQACQANTRVWTLQLRVRIDDATSGLDFAGTDFQLWYDILTSAQPNFIAVTEEYPSGATATAPDAYPPNLASMQAMKLNPAGGPTCVGDVKLTAGDINTTAMDPHVMSYTAPATFVLTPSNTTQDMSALKQQDLQARVRMANWGSAAFDSPDWKTMCTAVSAGTGDVLYNQEFDLRCTGPAPANPCVYDPDCDAAPEPNLWAHQCILVELSRHATPAGPVTARNLVLNPSSAYRNMRFGTTSTFEDDALISIRGLQGLAGKTERDVYLQLTTANMPVVPDPRKGRGGKPGYQVPFDAKAQAAHQRRGMDTEVLKQTLPHLVVRVFHDTGFLNVGAAVVREQPSFGYFPLHDGLIHGFRQWLTGEGLVQLDDDLYKITIPDNPGTAVITTYIQSVESLPDCFSACAADDRGCNQGCECDVECAGDKPCVEQCRKRKAPVHEPQECEGGCGRCAVRTGAAGAPQALFMASLLLGFVLVRVRRRRH